MAKSLNKIHLIGRLGGNMNNIPVEICQCGCGRRTWVADRTDKTRGWIKGQSIKFIRGHNGGKGESCAFWKGGQIEHEGYMMVLAPGHPRAGKKGYVAKQYLVVEKILGRILPLSAIVHHNNGKRKDNSPSNFVVCQDQNYHNLLHRRERAFKACGHACWRKCHHCKQYDDPSNLLSVQGRFHHKDCETRYKHERYLLKKGACH